MKEKGTLHLLPNLLGKEASLEESFPPSIFTIVPKLHGLIAESEKAGRLFLSHFSLEKKVHEIPLAVVNQKTSPKDYAFYLEPMSEQGEAWGYVSDAGLPGIADPGGLLVAQARRVGVAVQTHIGPSAIFLALMQAGLPGRGFSFHGYLPREPQQRTKAIRAFEKQSRHQNVQVFIEAPYRNAYTWSSLIETLQPETLLAACVDLMLPSQEIHVRRVADWKQAKPLLLEKRPAVFLFVAR